MLTLFRPVFSACSMSEGEPTILKFLPLGINNQNQTLNDVIYFRTVYLLKNCEKNRSIFADSSISIRGLIEKICKYDPVKRNNCKTLITADPISIFEFCFQFLQS